MRKHLVTLLLLAAIAAVVLGSWRFGSARSSGDDAFAGTDAQATQMLDERGAQPWFRPVFAPGSAEVESGLFAAQAGLGGIAFGYCVGRLQGRPRRDHALDVRRGTEAAGA